MITKFDSQNLGANIRLITDEATRAATAINQNRIYMVTIAERGPVNVPTMVTSMKEYVGVFGKYVPNAHGYLAADTIFSYWKKGIPPYNLYTVRVVGPAATTASSTAIDAASAQTACTLQAKNAGEWGNGVSYQILHSDVDYNIYNPTAAPTLVGSGTGGTFSAGTYDVCYTYVNAVGETLVSPTAQVVLSGATSKVTIRGPEVLPYGVDHIQPYIKVSGNWRKTAPSLTRETSIIVTAPPDSGASQAPASNDCTAPYLRLKVWYKNQVVDKDYIKFNEYDIEQLNREISYLDVTINDDNTSVIPNNFPKAMVAAQYLNGGFADHDNVTASEMLGEIDEDGTSSGLKCYDTDTFENGWMIVPGWTDTTIIQEIQNQCETYYRYGVANTPIVYTEEDMKDFARAGTINSQNVVTPFPCWAAKNNPDLSNRDIKKITWNSVDAHIAGNDFKASTQYAQFRPGAGYQFTLKGCPTADPSHNQIGGLYKDVNGNDQLNRTKATILAEEYGVMPLVNVSGVGPVIFDSVVRTAGRTIRFVHELKVLCSVYYYLDRTFRTNEIYQTQINALNYRKVFSKIRGLCSMVLESVFNMGGFIGAVNGGVGGYTLSDKPYDSFRVKCDEENNPVADLENGKVRVDFSYKNSVILRFLDIVGRVINLGDEFDI